MMLVSASHFALLGIVIGLCIHLCSGIRCHVCNSHYHSECDDPFDKTNNDYLVQCNASDILCRKIYHDIRGVTRVARTCGENKHPKYDKYMTGSEHYRTYVYHCYVDDCNDAPKNDQSATTWLVLTVALILYFVTTVL